MLLLRGLILYMSSSWSVCSSSVQCCYKSTAINNVQSIGWAFLIQSFQQRKNVFGLQKTFVSLHFLSRITTIFPYLFALSQKNKNKGNRKYRLQSCSTKIFHYQCDVVSYMDFLPDFLLFDKREYNLESFGL